MEVTSTVKPIIIESSASTVYTFQDVTLTASGGNGTFQWSVNGVAATKGETFTTSFKSGGLYSIEVTSGGKSQTIKIRARNGILSFTFSNQTGFDIVLPSFYIKNPTNGEAIDVHNYLPLKKGAFVDTVEFFANSNTTNLPNKIYVSGHIPNPIVNEATFEYSLPIDLNAPRHYDIVLTPSTQATWTILSVSNGSPSYIDLTFSDASTYHLQKE